MDINTLRSLSVVFVAIAFAGVCWWAFSPRRKQRFDEAANLPFADEQTPASAASTDIKQHKTEDVDLQSADHSQGQEKL